MSALNSILGSRYPVIQGPVGAMNHPPLVAAICEAGAFGMLALGFMTEPRQVKDLIAGVKDLTDKPFGANLMLMNPATPSILETLAGAGIKTVTTSTGNPKAVYPVIHDLGMKGLHVLLSVEHARRAEDAGVDGIVVSGAESGGLRSIKTELSTMVLVPLVADTVKVPIVAAGGIADSRGYRASLALGAQGVQVGTRFIASAESPAPDEWKKAITGCGEGDTCLLPLGKMRMRVISNEKLKKQLEDPSATLDGAYNLMNAPEAWNTGNFDLFPAGGGQVSALIGEIKTVGEIVREMVS